MKKDLICNECGHEWTMKPDKDGLFNGYGCPPCPSCYSGCGVSPNDYGDFKCLWCGHEFRRYGNGGLHLGMIPKCPDCSGPCDEV